MGEIKAQGKNMVSLNPPVCDFGLPAADFDLPGTDGRRHTLASCRGPNGLLVMFICNHCPYVKAVIDRIVRDYARTRHAWHRQRGDHEQRPRRLPGRLVRAHGATGQAARLSLSPTCSTKPRRWRAPMARCARRTSSATTASWNSSIAAASMPRAATRARLTRRANSFAAMRQIAETGRGPREQTASIGCSIKWRNG